MGSGDEESAEEESAEKESAEEESAESGPWHVIDLCAGKGFLATLLAVLYPRMMVTAVDKFEPTFLPHYEAAGIDNVRYAQLDVLAPNFVQALRTVIRTDGAGRRTIVLGMHLCGLLSLRAAELIRSLPEVEAVVLAPCCLPGAHQGRGYSAGSLRSGEPGAAVPALVQICRAEAEGRLPAEQAAGREVNASIRGEREAEEERDVVVMRTRSDSAWKWTWKWRQRRMGRARRGRRWW